MADITRLQELERRLALAADQQLDDLRAQVEAAGQEQVRAAVEAYRAKLVELLGGAAAARARLTQVTAGPIQEMGLGFLADAAQPFVEQALEARRELEAALRVGPVTLDLGAVAASVPGGRVVALLPIDSLHLDFNAGALRASGSGYLRENEAGGLLSGNLGVAKVTVAGLVAQRDGLLGVLALLRAEFRPTGIQLGLGFSLDSIGGIVGVHRTADVDELRRRLVDGSATEALFGGSTTASGVRATLETLARGVPGRPRPRRGRARPSGSAGSTWAAPRSCTSTSASSSRCRMRRCCCPDARCSRWPAPARRSCTCAPTCSAWSMCRASG